MPADPVHILRLQPIGPRAWRLCDAAVADSDADTVVAYVERHDDEYEATWVRGGGGYARFESVEDLIAAADRHLAACASRRGKPIPIPHLPPLATM
ncbi:hypothetical protein AB3M83_03700 [Microbacterium sp. 179-B 1A2 NHS]|uniref:hypothetical protein n=1 Tax=Microbacterium sp. 179-B 1A2 NHS TaxID=3142383 RepID=UPI0039A173FD